MKLKINLDQLLELSEFCYFLGLFYADGNFSKKYYRFEITTTEKDVNYFLSILNKFGDFKVYSRKRKNWKISHTIYASNKQLHTFLMDIGFNDKINNAEKILNHIKNIKCKQLFYCGYFDGDGCVYYHKKQFLRQASVAAPYEQNWDFMINLCKELEIKNFIINKTISKTKKHKNIHILEFVIKKSLKFSCLIFIMKKIMVFQEKRKVFRSYKFLNEAPTRD